MCAGTGDSSLFPPQWCSQRIISVPDSFPLHQNSISAKPALRIMCTLLPWLFHLALHPFLSQGTSSDGGVTLGMVHISIREKHRRCSWASSSQTCQKPRGLAAAAEEGGVGCFVWVLFMLSWRRLNLVCGLCISTRKCSQWSVSVLALVLTQGRMVPGVSLGCVWVVWTAACSANLVPLPAAKSAITEL